MYPDSPLAAALVLRLAKVSQESGRPQEAQKWQRVLQERYPNSPEAAAPGPCRAAAVKSPSGALALSGEMSNVGFRVQRGMELAARQAPVELVLKIAKTTPGRGQTDGRSWRRTPRCWPSWVPSPRESPGAAGAAQARGTAAPGPVPEGRHHPDRQPDFPGLPDAPAAGAGPGAQGLGWASSATPSFTPIPLTAAPFNSIFRTRWRPAAVSWLQLFTARAPGSSALRASSG